MVTLAAERLMDHILSVEPGLRYGSISGNYCTDKKTSAVNGILGRGKNVVTEALIPRELVTKRLRTTAERMATLNTRKNLLGSLVAGSLRSANAHYANMLLAFYLATGQDAANIVEGSQGITRAEDRDGDLYFSCTLPHLIVGPWATARACRRSRRHSRAWGAARIALRARTRDDWPSWRPPQCGAGSSRSWRPRPIQVN